MTAFPAGRYPRHALPTAQVAKAFPNVNIVPPASEGNGRMLYACLEHSNIYVDMAQAWPYDIKIFIKECTSTHHLRF